MLSVVRKEKAGGINGKFYFTVAVKGDWLKSRMREIFTSGSVRGVNEVLNRWRTLDLPIMPPGPVSFHAFPHKLPGLHSPAKHACVYDYKTPQHI